MSHINFVIPQNPAELLIESDDQYYVRNTVTPKEMLAKFKDARQYFESDGAEYIIDNFDLYYSVLHHTESIPMDLITKAFTQLHKAVYQLNKNISFLLEDRESLQSNDDGRMKYLSVIKMLLYVYTRIVIMIEQKTNIGNTPLLDGKGRIKKKTKAEAMFQEFNKTSIVVYLNNIMQRDINIFWDPPVVEQVFVTMMADVCYCFLETQTIKQDKETRIEIFNMIGTLLKSYDHGNTFVLRVVQLIKVHEHLVHCVPDGIRILVNDYKAKGLVRDFVREVTEWQTDEKYQDNQGAKNCSIILSELAVIMPDLMIPEVMYLNTYSDHESYALRNSVLAVIVEVVLKVLTKLELTDEERESRDIFLQLLEEHTYDNSAHVRSKVYQFWTRLQKENAIPIKFHHKVLEKAVAALNDKAALVRKNAASFVTASLTYNIYAAKLKMSKLQEDLNIKVKTLEQAISALTGSSCETTKERQARWQDIEKDIKAAIEKGLAEQTDDEKPALEKPKDMSVSDVICSLIDEGKYDDVFEWTLAVSKKHKSWKDMEAELNDEKKVDLHMFIIQSIYFNMQKISDLNTTGASEETFTELLKIQNEVDYCNNAVLFLQMIDRSIMPMAELLQSATISDMQEAVEFFVTAYKFSIENIEPGINEMLHLMQKNDSERRNVIIEAFQKIYLTSDCTNENDHSIYVTNGLISFLKSITLSNYGNFKAIISEWVSKGALQNRIVDILWKYFTKSIEVSDEESRAALQLLGMASWGRKTIMEKNIKMVATLVFSERGANDMLLFATACEALSVVGYDDRDITQKEHPFKIKTHDVIWTDMTNIIIENFTKEIPYYGKAATQAINLIYRLCSKPDFIAEKLVHKVNGILQKALEVNDRKVVRFQLVRFCHILGEIAVRQLNYLDDTVYRELKRRNYIREERENSKKGKKTIKKSTNKSITSASRSLNVSVASNAGSTVSVDDDESVLEGAQAEDTDAEFILHTLENNTVSPSSLLGSYFNIIKSICQRPDLYDDVYIQCSAIKALLRYMLVSNHLCTTNVQLIFTILERSQFVDVKCLILIHLSDMLERFPNVIEPWSPRLYSCLRDGDFEVRKTAFFVLANLLLRDMIRVQGYVSEMAYSMVDSSEIIRKMSESFFNSLAHKGNHLYNVLPDVFSQLCEKKDLKQEDLRNIMKYLFGLIDKAKMMENLVERFCVKFKMMEEESVCNNIAYCLNLIKYNEKGLKRLLDNFDNYKHAMHFAEVYSFFKQIINNSNKLAKAEMKAIITEIEEKINSVFELNENGVQPPPKPVTFKKPKSRPAKRAKKKKSSDSDEDEEEKENRSFSTRRRQKK